MIFWSSIHPVFHSFIRASKIKFFYTLGVGNVRAWKKLVWLYAKRVANKAYCSLRREKDSEVSCLGDITGLMGKHSIHEIIMNGN